MKKSLMFINFIIFSIVAYIAASLLSNVIAPSSPSMEVLIVCITILLSFIAGLLGVILQEINNLKNK